MNTTYPSIFSDAEWECLQQHLPSEPLLGRPGTNALREIFDAIFYILRTGCPWRYLPCIFPPWQTVFYHFRRLRLKGIWFRLLTAFRTAERERVGRNAQPSASMIAARSVKTVEESASICGFDAHKHVKGRKRHILVDTLGLLLAVYVTPADLHDSKGAKCLLAGLAPRLSRLLQDLGRWSVSGARVGRLVLGRGRLGPTAVSGKLEPSGSKSMKASSDHHWPFDSILS